MKKGSMSYMIDYMKENTKKILVLGNAESLWVKEFIEFILLPEKKAEIFVITKNSGGEFSEFYKKNSVHLIETDTPIKFLKNKRLTTVINLYRKIKKERLFDVIHIHYVPANIMSLFYSKFILKYGRVIITSFWGSDLLKNDSANKWQKTCVEKSNYVTVSGSILKEAFERQYGKSFSNKLRIVKFGISAFSFIDAEKEINDKKAIKKKLGIDPEKTLISIGYNARESQQHLRVVEQINTLTSAYKDKLEIVLQFGTGVCSKEYKDALIEQLKKTGIKYVFTTGFLDKKQTAILRSATDIFIHAQETDAFSASVQEYLYAGIYVVNPKWINYKELKQLGVKYIEYGNFEELPEIIYRIMDNMETDNGEQNRKILSESASWDAQKSDWLELYS